MVAREGSPALAGTARPVPATRRSSMVSPVLAGEINRGRVLKMLYARGPLARTELATLTGSTRATIGQIVQPLLDEGLLEEREPVASGAQGGKPARPVWFSREGWPVGALLLLPTGAQAALVTASGTVAATVSVRFRPRRTHQSEIVDRLAAALEEAVATAASPLRGIGVAVGGMVDTLTGQIVRVDLAPGFNGLALGPMLAERLGVPTYVDLQPRAQALGDLLFGSGRGQESFASVYFGEGIGAGFILDGAVHRGARGAGGEVGHAVVAADGATCRCGLRGCWETVASTRWLREEAARLGLAQPSRTSAASLVAAAPTDPVARALLDRYTANIAVGLANIQQTLGIVLFLVHGDPVGGGEQLRVTIEDEVRRRSFAHPGGLPRVVFADRDDFATVRGAAGIVLSRSLNVAF